jgi:hypothetical protein
MAAASSCGAIPTFRRRSKESAKPQHKAGHRTKEKL